MITADTITDEQIRELLQELRTSPGSRRCTRREREDMRACFVALSTGVAWVSSWTKETARARCAEILNARLEESK